MGRLTEGIQKFQAEVVPGRREQLAALASSQDPKVLIVACADSRVDPSLITQTDPGDIFVIRNAGNVVPPADAANNGSAASIEFAVKALNVEEIIVCGHSDCGAVKGALAPEGLTSLPHVAAWLEHVTPALSGLGEGPSVDAAVEANVLQQIEHLRSFDFIRDAVENGGLVLSGWVYDVGTGAVRVSDGGDFTPISA